MPDKKPRKVRKDKGVKRGSLKDQRFMKEMVPLFGPFDPKKLEEDKFMKEMSELFIVHKTKEQLDKEHVEAGIKYNQSLPPNERVVFNMDLMRHIIRMNPTSVTDAVAYAKENKDDEYKLENGSRIEFYDVISLVIKTLKDKETRRIPIFDNFSITLRQSFYDENNDESYESLYKFFKKLKISSIFDFGSWNYLDLPEGEVIFGDASEEIEMYLDYVNDSENEYDESDIWMLVPGVFVEDNLSDDRRQKALERLEAVVKQLNLKDKPQRK